MASGMFGMWLRRAAGLLAVSIAIAGCRGAAGSIGREWPELQLTAQDRLLILAPHPDDEVIGCGGIIQKAVAMSLPLRVVVFTYGDNNEWSFFIYRKRPVVQPKAIQRMGLVRHDESVAAGRILGVPTTSLTFLGYPDFGTLAIWNSHWNDRPPYRSMLTRVTSVPYASALRPGAPYKGEEIVRDLTAILREVKPTKIFVSHPGDHMPDHQALYLFLRVALWDLEGEMAPEVYPYLVHFKRWPGLPRHQASMPLNPPSVLTQALPWEISRLSPEEIARKQEALEAHRTQYAYSARYLRSFVRINELFGDFPMIHLAEDRAKTLSPTEREPESQTPEQLTPPEREQFVGVSWRHVQLDHDDVTVSVEFSRQLAKAAGVSVFIFGYRHGRPFGEMPKLHVKLSGFGYAVYDQDQRLPGSLITVERKPTQATLRIPLKLLGDPQRILTSAHSYLNTVPLDWVSWRVLQLPAREPAAAAPLTERRAGTE